MKYKKILLYLYLYFLWVIIGNSFCKDKNGCENNSNDLMNNNINSYLSSFNLSPLNDNIPEYRMNSKFYPNEINYIINPGIVQPFLLFKESIYIFNVNSSNYNIENELILYFYPLDCEIQMMKEGNDIKIEKISNYENDAYYAIIKKEDLNESKIIINTLINSKDEINKNRTFHLIINSFEYNNNANLTIKEKDPTFLTFNNILNKINLKYNLINNDIFNNPISISFFIKERVKFVVTVYSGSREQYRKTVAYLDRILIEPDIIQNTSSSYIDISIEKIEEGKDASMFIKIIEDYSKPIYFQKNLLNIGFIPSNTLYQFYYMEIFEGEHGEIILNNKRYNGMLFSKLLPKQELNEIEIFNDSKLYPNEKSKNNILEYDEYSQKIIINYTNTTICKDGCYLLITYFSIYFKNKTNSEIIGTEFTLLSRIFDQEEEFRTQIINIPLNEYIFGTFQFSSIKIHYYSLYIPEKEKDLTLEINLNYISIYIKKGIKKINIFNLEFVNQNYFGNLIYNITPKEFGDEYITFALSSHLPIENTHYYFRILQRNSSNNDYLIYPLDTNKANICSTTDINGIHSCFFFIDNIYKDLYNDLIIYAYGNEYVKYTAWIIEDCQNDYYSINLANLEYKNLTFNNIYFKINKTSYVDSKYILIRIESSIADTLTILTNFYDNEAFSPIIQIYSYQLVYLYDNETLKFDFSWVTQEKYRIEINNTYGNGEITFDPDSAEINQYNTLISGDRTLSYIITEELKNIQIYNNRSNNRVDENELIFNIKIVYQLDKKMIEQIYFDNYYNRLEKEFPIKFFLKEIEYTGSDINFYFNFDFCCLGKEDLKIKAYGIEYDIMKLITDKTFTPIDYLNEIDGIFDNRINQGLIIFENEKRNTHLDNYYLIVIDKTDDNTIPSNITMDIYASSKKNAFNHSIPLNKYMSGSFNLSNDQNKSQKYFINDAIDKNINRYIIEFSSNYKHLNLILSDSVDLYYYKEEFGIKKYFVSINQNNPDENYFEIEINKNIPKKEKNNSNYCQSANYLVIYYQIERSENNNNYNYKPELFGKIRKNSKNITIENKNPLDLNYDYTITLICNIYQKNNILEDELINTTAIIESESKFTKNTTVDKNDKSITFDYEDLTINNKDYIGTIFIIFQNENSKRNRIYYSFPFEIIEEDDNIDDDDENKKIYKLIIIISTISLVIIIIIIILAISYRKILNKNKDLEKRVNQISFADENSTKDEENNITFV